MVGHAASRALLVLSPALIATSEVRPEDEAIRAARIDPVATQRLLDILQDISSRFERALVQADWEAELENALVDAAAKLPAAESSAPNQLREAG